jgi:hypothetical protein
MSETIQQVRYEKTVSIGDRHTTESIEGTVDEVLKVLGETQPKEVTNNITINAAPEQNIYKVCKNMKQQIDKGIKHG